MTPPPSPSRRDSVSPAASDLADALVPVAAELIGTVRDFDPADTAEILDRVGVLDERSRALVVTLAAMVPVDRSPSELLAWTRVTIPPKPRPERRLPREHGTLRGYRQHGPGDPACGPCRSAHAEDRAARRVGRAA